MIRENLNQCIELFNGDYYNRSMAVRGMEQLGEWETASKYWEILNDSEQAASCLMIHNAISRGNAYRADTKHLMDWVDNSVELGVMTLDEAIKTIYPELSKIYDYHYNSNLLTEDLK